MRNHTEDSYLIFVLVSNRDKQQELLAKGLYGIYDNMSILDILKQEGVITMGVLEDEGICTEPENVKFIDDLIYEYFMYSVKNIFC